jgi:hypothetical protein
MSKHLAFVAVVALATPCLAGTPVALQIKPGLWEFTNTPKVSGDTVISDAMLAHVPAAQQAQFLAETRKQIAAPQKVRECLTQAKFEKQLLTAGPDCNVSIPSNSAIRLEVRTTCRSVRGDMHDETRNDVVVAATSSSGTLHSAVTRGSKTMTVESAENGHWIAADCGGVKDIQIMP